MKALALAGMLAAGLAWGSPAQAGPLKGGMHDKRRIEANASLRFKVTFKGNERACFIVIGDHRPVVDLVVSVYDEKERLITRVDPGGDICAAIWYPERDATYIVEVENRGEDYNECYIVAK
jgi:hypothetical protein